MQVKLRCDSMKFQQKSVTLRLLFGYAGLFEKYVSTVSRHDGHETSAQSLAGMPDITRTEPRFEDSVKFFFGCASVLSCFFHGQRNWNFQVGPSLD